MPDRYLTPQAVLDRGLTYRRLDHWTRRGWLRPTHDGGTGHNREWPQRELRIADLMRRLIKAGLTPEAAAQAARTHEDGRPLISIGPGLVLAIDTNLLTETR
jgi:DNA-binding transcriptional MerR regulator